MPAGTQNLGLSKSAEVGKAISRHPTKTSSCSEDQWLTMDLQDAQNWLNDVLYEVSIQFQKVPGSAILLRYVKSSYQNDPVRSAVELFLVLFAIRYLLSPKYSTQKKSYVKLSEEASATGQFARMNRADIYNRKSTS